MSANTRANETEQADVAVLGGDVLALTGHAHPTLPEAVLESALGFEDATIHLR